MQGVVRLRVTAPADASSVHRVRVAVPVNEGAAASLGPMNAGPCRNPLHRFPDRVQPPPV